MEHIASPSFMRTLARAYITSQKLRLMITNRIGAQVRSGEVTEAEAKLLVEHIDVPIRAVEKRIKKDMADTLPGIPIYDEWFSKFKGIGPIIAGGMIGEIYDITRFLHITNLFSWAGMGFHDGMADHRQAGKQSRWNQNMKVLCWKLGKSAVMSGLYTRQEFDRFKKTETENNVPYLVTPTKESIISRKLVGLNAKLEKSDDGLIITKKNVDEILKRLDVDQVLICLTDGHVDSRARRKVVKLFLGLTFMKWRELEGLPPGESYGSAFLHHDDVTPKEALMIEERLKAEAKRKSEQLEY